MTRFAGGIRVWVVSSFGNLHKQFRNGQLTGSSRSPGGGMGAAQRISLTSTSSLDNPGHLPALIASW